MLVGVQLNFELQLIESSRKPAQATGGFASRNTGIDCVDEEAPDRSLLWGRRAFLSQVSPGSCRLGQKTIPETRRHAMLGDEMKKWVSDRAYFAAASAPS